MKRKFITLFLAASLTLSGCAVASSGAETISESSAEATETQEDESADETEAEEEVEVEKELFDVVITIPADYVGETTQEELQAEADELGYTATLNEDGSATYVTTKSQHKRMMDSLADSIRESLDELVGSETYPNITDITVNDDFTEYVITITNESLDLSESFLVLGLYMYSGMYYIFDGSEVDNIHVDYVNADTGEVITSANSSDMEDSSTE
ncbi:MAG: hypothetical protein LUC90_04570 [Lachnospiraceae bacterium]|nr:hypothetical protein [Lachnospiraceae bacterium]